MNPWNIKSFCRSYYHDRNEKWIRQLHLNSKMRQEPVATAVFKTTVTENSALTSFFLPKRERKEDLFSAAMMQKHKARSNDAWSEVSRDDEMHSKESVSQTGIVTALGISMD
jgi:hypothetical protein